MKKTTKTTPSAFETRQAASASKAPVSKTPAAAPKPIVSPLVKKAAAAAVTPAPAAKSAPVPASRPPVAAAPRPVPTEGLKPVSTFAPKPVSSDAPRPASAPAYSTPAPKVAPAAVTATTIAVNLDVGFGNSLFVRGSGSGLSWEKGTPMKCVAGDLWTVTLPGTTKAIVFKIVLNDTEWSLGDDFTAAPGAVVTVKPSFY